MTDFNDYVEVKLILEDIIKDKVGWASTDPTLVAIHNLIIDMNKNIDNYFNMLDQQALWYDTSAELQ